MSGKRKATLVSKIRARRHLLGAVRLIRLTRKEIKEISVNQGSPYWQAFFDLIDDDLKDAAREINHFLKKNKIPLTPSHKVGEQ